MNYQSAELFAEHEFKILEYFLEVFKIFSFSLLLAMKEDYVPNEILDNIAGFNQLARELEADRNDHLLLHHLYGDFRLHEVLSTINEISESDIVLDAGCGQGRLTYAVSKSASIAVGIDVSIESLRIARANYGDKESVCFALADVTASCFKNDSFDIVTSCEVVEHVPNPEKMLSEMSRLLKRRGYLAISTPNPMWPFFHISTMVWVLTRIRSIERKLKRKENWWNFDWGFDRWILPWHLDLLLWKTGFRVHHTRFMLFIPDARTLTFRILKRLMSNGAFSKLLRSLEKLETLKGIRWAGSRYMKLAQNY